MARMVLYFRSLESSRRLEDNHQGFITVGENNPYIPPTLDGWVYIIPIHEPLDGPLYTRAQYTPTPPRSLNNRRSGVQDWTTKKLTPPAVCTTDAAVFKTGQEESTRRVQRANKTSS